MLGVSLHCSERGIIICKYSANLLKWYRGTLLISDWGVADAFHPHNNYINYMELSALLNSTMISNHNTFLNPPTFP